MIQGSSDFGRDGKLKSTVSFSFCGSVSATSIRQFQIFKAGEEESRSVEWSLEIQDSYGLKMTYWKRGLTREGIEEIQSKIPYNQTIAIKGEITIRRGNTYLNAKWFLYPDGTSIYNNGCCLQEDET
jgi:hypothetical protein